MQKGRWISRAWRGLRPDRNPLRRKSDRVEAFILGGLIVAAATVAPLVAVETSHWTYDSAIQMAQVQRETGHQVTAVLVAAPATTTSGYTVASLVEAQARWTAPDSRPHAGQIPVPAGSSKGQTFRIWIDAAGDVTGPPLTRAQAADQGTFVGVMAVIVTLMTCIATAGITRFAVNRRRIARWEADWAVTAPMWSRQRW
jgi:hypothetical protein